MKRFRVYKKIRVRHDLPLLEPEAASHLTKCGLTRAPGEPGYFNWNWTIEATSSEEAGLVAEAKLQNILEPYGANYESVKSMIRPEQP